MAENGTVPSDSKMPKNETEDDSGPITSGLLFSVKEVPPAGVALFGALQIVLATISGVVSTSFLIYLNLCADRNPEVLVTLISTSLFCVGLTTFGQATFGIRLPVIQASSVVFIIPVSMLMKSDKWKCPVVDAMQSNASYINASYVNGSYTGGSDMDGNYIDSEPWKPRLAEISGSLAVASCVQVLLGATGLIGVVSHFIGPLTVTPLLSCIAFSLGNVVTITASPQWGIALLTAFLVILFNVVFGKFQVPCLSWSRKDRFHFKKIQFFRIFANILGLCCGWILCLILTVTNVFPDDEKSQTYRARTDIKLSGLKDTPWFFIPYPGQWGPLTISASATAGMLAGVLASVLESLGDYRVTAFTCKVPPPPKHAVNRAVLMEGLGSVISGAFGAAHATTTYSEVTGYISYTGMASRIVFQIAGIIYFAAGLIGKIGGVLALVPDPVIGGLVLIGSGMILSSAIGALHSVNLQLPRNLFVLGVSIMVGVTMPDYFATNADVLNIDTTGVAQIILTNGPLLAGVSGFLLDNCLPGKRKERGFVEDADDVETEFEPSSSNEESNKKHSGGLEVYEFNFPCCKNVSWPKFLEYVPISPLFRRSSKKTTHHF